MNDQLTLYSFSSSSSAKTVPLTCCGLRGVQLRMGSRYLVWIFFLIVIAVKIRKKKTCVNCGLTKHPMVTEMQLIIADTREITPSL